jgi:hypothetical protein
MNDMAEFARARSAAAAAASGADAPSPAGDGRPMAFKTVEAGAATEVWAATAIDPELIAHNGAYLANCGLGVLGADPGVNGFLPYLLDDDHAAALWDLSEQLVGTAFEL